MKTYKIPVQRIGRGYVLIQADDQEAAVGKLREQVVDDIALTYHEEAILEFAEDFVSNNNLKEL